MRVADLRSRNAQRVRLACAPIHLSNFLGVVIRLVEAAQPDLQIDVVMLDPEQVQGPDAFDRLLQDNEADFVATINKLPSRGQYRNVAHDAGSGHVGQPPRAPQAPSSYC